MSKIYNFSIIIATLIVFLLLPTLIFAQSASNLDEDFMKSLPEELQQELNTENNEENQVDKLLNSKTSSIEFAKHADLGTLKPHSLAFSRALN